MFKSPRGPQSQHMAEIQTETRATSLRGSKEKNSRKCVYMIQCGGKWLRSLGGGEWGIKLFRRRKEKYEEDRQENRRLRGKIKPLNWICNKHCRLHSRARDQCPIVCMMRKHALYWSSSHSHTHPHTHTDPFPFISMGEQTQSTSYTNHLSNWIKRTFFIYYQVSSAIISSPSDWIWTAYWLSGILSLNPVSQYSAPGQEITLFSVIVIWILQAQVVLM